MKLPKKKEKELEKKGKSEPSPLPGGGAMGRLRQFEEERGMEETDLANPAADDSRRDEKKTQHRKK